MTSDVFTNPIDDRLRLIHQHRVACIREYVQLGLGVRRREPSSTHVSAVTTP